MTRLRGRERGISLIMVMLACVLFAAALSVMLNVGTAQLRRSVEDLRSLQARAGADAGAGWFRALLLSKYGHLSEAIVALGESGGVENIVLDPQTTVRVTVSLVLPGATGHKDHLDGSLQYGNNIDEQPVQLVSTADVLVDGSQVAERTSTSLLRVFLNGAPYSEIVGVVDDAGPDAIDSPGDPAGQAAAVNTTDLRVHAYTRTGDGPPKEVDNFQDQQWSDGNSGGGGVLP